MHLVHVIGRGYWQVPGNIAARHLPGTRHNQSFSWDYTRKVGIITQAVSRCLIRFRYLNLGRSLIFLGQYCSVHRVASIVPQVLTSIRLALLYHLLHHSAKHSELPQIIEASKKENV